MIGFAAHRLAGAAVVLVLLSAVVFLLQEISPVDPVRVAVGPSASREVVEAERQRLGLDDPAPQQYVRYVERAVQGDLGQSLRTRRPVSQDIAEFLPATIELGLYAILAAGILAILLGTASAARWRGAAVARVALIAAAAAPTFLLALVGILVFFQQLGWLPATGRTSIADVPDGPTGLLTVDGLLAWRWDVVGDALHHLVMPALCVAIGPAVAIGRVLRSGLVSATRTDYARTARAKGLRETTVVLRHGLRNAAGPALAMTGLQAGLMLAGVVVVESVFAWPGIGLYVAQSIPTGDFPAIAGVTLLLGVGYVVINATADLLHAAADPRVRA